MNDVAEAAAVSIATVSAFLNGTSKVSPKLTQRIEAAISDTGYKRNAIARSLKMGTTHTIGLCVPHITNPFFTQVVSVIQQAFDRAGYAVMLFCTDEHLPDQQDQQIRLLLDRMVDGLIVARVGDDAGLKRLSQGTHVPIVMIDRVCEGVDADAVLIDNRQAVREAIAYLIGLGHRRIGYISASVDVSTIHERAEGYREALVAAGLSFDANLIRLGSFHEADGYRAAMQLLMQPERPTAVFSANNPMMVGAMKALRDLGLGCPGDVSIACFDDFPWSEVFQPQMTTVAQPVETIGEQAVRLLLERLQGLAPDERRRVVLQGRLMVRTSCAPPSTWQSAAPRPALV